MRNEPGDRTADGVTAVPVGRASRALAFFLAISVALNVATSYEWLWIRTTDLYSWGPASDSNYLCDWGSGLFVVPQGYTPTDVPLEDLPGVQLLEGDSDDLLETKPFEEMFDDDRQQELVRRLTAYKQTLENITSIEEIDLTIEELFVVLFVDNDQALDWVSWLVQTNVPRVQRRFFQSTFTLQRRYNKCMGVPVRRYWKSTVFWLLMVLPLVFLVWNVYIPHFSQSSQEALFTALPLRSIQFIRWVLFPFFCWTSLWSAGQFAPKSLLGSSLSPILCVGIVTVDLFACFVVARSGKRTTAISTAARWTSIAIRIFAVLTASLAFRDWEIRNDTRYLSCAVSIMVQLLACGVLGQVFSIALPTTESISGSRSVIDQDAIDSGLFKFAFSMIMYTAGATKIGEAGLRWIDDRFIAQLSLRGRYHDDLPFPLEAFMLWMPPFLRAMGMLIVLLMELSAIFSWWDFGNHLRVWVLFMVVSTMSIGVPIIPGGILGPLYPVMGSMLERFLEAMLVCIGIGLVMGTWRARPRREHTAMSDEAHKKFE